MNTIHDEMGRTFTDDYISTKSRQIKAHAIGNNRGREKSEQGAEKARLPVANPGTSQETVSSHQTANSVRPHSLRISQTRTALH